MSYYVRTKEGVPLLRDFASTEGTPIVIDVLTSKAYYVYKNIVYPVVSGVLLVTSAFSEGFSDGFANGP
jgi:hypothetical protein